MSDSQRPGKLLRDLGGASPW